MTRHATNAVRLATLLACAGLAACGPDSPTTGGSSGTTPTPANPSNPAPSTPSNPAPSEGTTTTPVPTPPTLSPADLQAAASASNQFALDLFRRAATASENAIISPLNVRHALGVTWAGAAGQTRLDMATALRFSEAHEDAEHAALMGLLAHAVATEGEDAPEISGAARVWVQQGRDVVEAFQTRLETTYGAAFAAIDFQGNADAVRGVINRWVAGETRNRIPEVLPRGSVSSDTRLVLSTAIYMNADWVTPFEKESTRNGPFTLASGQSVQVPMMHQSEHQRHAVSESYVAVERPYRGSNLAMLLVMPTTGTLEQFETDLDAPAWEAIVESLGNGEVRLTMPKFEFESAADLAGPLKAMGMAVAFSDQADFSRMVSEESLMIGGVYHGAFLRVDEKGTEAAAATAVTMNVTSAPIMDEPVEITLDRPFVFAIRDLETGAIVFMGRVVDPR